MVHVDGAHHNVMVASIANQLSRCVEAHRLAIDDRRRVGSRIVVFQVSRNVDNQCETGGVRFRKTIFAKATNLLKNLQGEFFGQPPFQHAVDQLIAKLVNDTGTTPSPHGSPQLVGFARCESSRHDG